MARLTKRAKRAVRRVTDALGKAVLGVTPVSVREAAAPAARYIDMLVFDHLIIRLGFPNRHRLATDVWRAAQPLPHQIRRLARKKKIRTIVNLRGPLPNSTYELERQACERAGIKLVDFRIRSRDAPHREELIAARELFQEIEYPILMHCKSGADRVGLMSALYKHVRHGVPIEEARHQLGLRYGHFRQADTGILDFFFDRYVAYNARTPVPFYYWVENVYDPAELKRLFRAKHWANRLVNGVLRRE